MRIIIGLGMLVIMICIFFIFYTFTHMVQGEIGCLFSENIATDCDVVKVGFDFIVDLTIIVVLLFVMVAVIYLVISHAFSIEKPITYLSVFVKKKLRVIP
jgi:hypothetical protein